MNKQASSPYINHFLQPDSIIPDPSNPQAWNRYSYVGNNPVNFNDPTGHEPHGPGSCYDEGDIECKKNKQDRLYSLAFRGTGKDDVWTPADWKKYYKKRDVYWKQPEKWINADPEHWESFALHVKRLASHYDLSISAEKDQFVRDFALLFGGISSNDNKMQAAIDSASGPEINPILNESTTGLATQYQDTFGGNQSHHYAGVFFLAYFSNPSFSLLANAPRDMNDKGGVNFGDLSLDVQASSDAYYFKYYPGNASEALENYILRLIGP